ncbi:ATP-binding cassette domain-containing protein [Gracilibacillus alcaliphilus]|uniref:ATP-binding cassette domain-containing protein n=1 Tax=Gracilibacillus alcaliphilus TaxID=1401441 RepID=UPI00195B3046|nr:ATP-binding cassette domain-containing protein [Gracilibacillus alcaliphilus]MBM7676868.1 ABC-2 type transport system ATP-binding protein [Gracilibacillus alcaliphilus]
MEYIVQMNRLTKKIKEKELISDISIHIKKGEIYGLLGSNGAGKTTILKMLTGITRPTKGEILILNKRLAEQTKSVLARVGSIIEYPVFFEHLTAFENLKLHCEYLGFFDEHEMKQALQLVNLKGIEEKTVKDFSLGMKQRLGIARAIITKPELIVLDEPTNGLDPIGIKDMRHLIGMLNKEYGMTFVISSHILGELEQIVDRVGVIHHGKLLNEITLADIRNERSDYIELVVTDVKQAVYLLENDLNLSNMKIIQDRKIRIYDTAFTPNEISKTLILHDIEIEEIKKHSNSLEDYFYQQINGGNGDD